MTVKRVTNLKLIFIAACFTNLTYEALSASVASSPPSNLDIEDRSWWIPKRIPEYLTYNATKYNNSTDSPVTIKYNNSTDSPVTVKYNNSVTVPVSAPAPVPETGSELPKANCTKILNQQRQPTSNDVIHFTKYQQPEPKYQDGIRFPATASIPKNKYGSGIKPRYENNDFVKNLLLRWMNG